MTELEKQRAGAEAEVTRARELGESGDLEGALAELSGVVERFGEASDEVVTRCVASAIWEQARLWRRLRMPELRMSALDQLIERFRSSSDPYVSNFVTRAFYLSALDRQEAGDVDEAEALFDETLRRAHGVADIRVREAAIYSTGSKAWLTSLRGLHREALRLLDQLLEPTADLVMERPGYLGYVLTTKLEILNRARDDVQALRVADELIERFADSTEHDQRERVALALVQKMDSLARLGRVQAEAELVFEQLADGFGYQGIEVLDRKIANVDTKRDPSWQQTLAPYLFLRGALLHELGRLDEGVDAFSALIEQLGDQTDLAVATVVQAARAALADWRLE